MKITEEERQSLANFVEERERLVRELGIAVYELYGKINELSAKINNSKQEQNILGESILKKYGYSNGNYTIDLNSRKIIKLDK